MTDVGLEGGKGERCVIMHNNNMREKKNTENNEAASSDDKNLFRHSTSRTVHIVEEC